MDSSPIFQIQNKIQKVDFFVEAVIKKNGKTILKTDNSDIPISAASIIKLGIALYFNQLYRKDPSLLQKEILISKSKIVNGAGILQFLHLERVTVKDLIFLMLSMSDNTATNLLIELSGLKEINAWLNKHYQTFSLERYLMLPSPDDKDNFCTAQSAMNIFEDLLSMASPTDTYQKLINSSLHHQVNRLKLVAISAPDFKTYNKTGELLNCEHDIARFTRNEEIIDVCILSKFNQIKQRNNSIRLMQDVGYLLTQ